MKRQKINAKIWKVNIVLASLVLFFVVSLFFGQAQAQTPPDTTVPIGEGDLKADMVLGQPDFYQAIPKEIVPFKVAGPGGVIVDKSSHPNKIYVYDGMNSRILGFADLGVCGNDSSRRCTTDSDCFSSTCQIQVGGKTGLKKADIVIGQPDFNTAACNGNGTNYDNPSLAMPPASEKTLCSNPPSQISIFEGGAFAGMQVDSAGNLYVPDVYNNRVLKYISPLATDNVADEVWGQDGQDKFINNLCNKGGSPTDSSLCLPNALDIDSQGNMWVVDSGNKRVLRFPEINRQISKTADRVLGQTNFNTNGRGLQDNQLYNPGAVRVDSQGKVYVGDSGTPPEYLEGRVLVYEPPLSDGMSGRRFASGFREPHGIEFDVVTSDPASGGIWISDFNKDQLVLFALDGTPKKVLFKSKYVRPDEGWPTAGCTGNTNLCDSRGSIGITSDGDVIAAGSADFQNIHFYKHPIETITPRVSPIPPAATFFSPPYGHNYLFNRGFLSPRGLVITSAQTIVADAQRIMYWNTPNGLADLANGKPADGVAGVADFESLVTPHLSRIASDQRGNLWVSHENKLEIYNLPLTFGQMPNISIDTKDFKILGQAAPLNLDVDIYGNYADPQGRYLWLVSPGYDRAFRVRIPQDKTDTQNYVIDVIIGGEDIPYPASRINLWQMPCAGVNSNGQPYHPGYPNSLCYPASITEDTKGHVYVSDYQKEQAGSGRFLRFDKSLFPLETTTLITKDTTQASQNFAGVKGWEPAFDSLNRMVLGFSAYDASRYPFVYNNILAQTGPNLLKDAQLTDFYSQAFTAKFDSFDNLYVADLNWGRVLIYKKPFILAVPTNLTATAVYPAQINLDWQDNSNNEDGFRIERSLDGTSFTLLATVSSNIVAYNDTGLIPGTRYYYRISAYNSVEDSDCSNTAQAATPLVTPTNLRVDRAFPDHLELMWQDNSNNETGFKIEYSADGTNFSQVGNLPANNILFWYPVSITTTPSYYRVYAYNSLANSAYTTLTYTPLAAPTNLTAIAISSTQINLTWQDNPSNGTLSFKIFCSTNGQSFYYDGTTFAPATTHTPTWLTPGQTYYYKIYAVKAGACSPFSAVTQVTIPTIPVAPANLAATVVSPTQINLSWTDNSNNENGFKIERSTDGTSFIWSTTVSANITTYSDAGLTDATSYYYRVRAYNISGNSAYSNTAQATTPDATPPTVTITSPANNAVVSGNIIVTTNASDNVGVVGVQFKLDGVNLGIEDTTSPYTISWSTATTTNGPHTLTVIARDAAGNQATSATVNVTVDNTPPLAPILLDDGLYTASTATLNVSWTSSDPDSGIAEYQYAIGTTQGSTDIVSWASAGTNTSVSKTGLSLQQGQTYYFSVKAKNGAGLWSDIGYSDGIKVDTTSATKPVVTDTGAYVPSNLRLDCWVSSSDPESGIVEYQYAIGTSPGATDVLNWASAGTTTHITKFFLTLPLQQAQTYYFSVKAKNGAGLWSDIGFSDGIKVDTTPATMPVLVDDGTYSPVNWRLKCWWSSSDTESGIVEYQYAIGTSPGATDVISWISVGVNTGITKSSLKLQQGQTYYFSVKAKNGAGLWSDIGFSDGIRVDITPPATPVVTDRGVYTGVNAQLMCSWASSDPESGVSEYQYAIGTTQGGTDIVNWVSVGTNTAVLKGGLSLQQSQTYYFSVLAKNGAGLSSNIGYSDGIKVDTTPATTPVVIDDGAYTTDTTTLHASWLSTDPESGIVDYQYWVGTTQGSSNVVGVTSVGTNTSITRTGLSLQQGQTYYFTVIAMNGAGGFYSQNGYSDGITIDTTLAPPSKFTNLSAAMPLLGPATFNFTYSGSASYFYIHASTLPDMSWDVYGNFAAGAASPVTLNNPQARWDKYSCNRTLYWQVVSSNGDKSPIQATTVGCN